MFWIPFVLGCASPPEPPAARHPPEPHWVRRSDKELNKVITTACEASVEDGKPLLIEFSAPWCIDCRALELLEKEEHMISEYANWHRVRVDVGRFDRHPDLIKAFEVRAIANWVALQPDNCAHAATTWRKLDQRVVELDSGAAREEGPEGLLMWLKMARSRVR